MQARTAHRQFYPGPIDLTQLNLQVNQIRGLSFEKSAIGLTHQFLFQTVSIQVRLDLIENTGFKIRGSGGFGPKTGAIPNPRA